MVGSVVGKDPIRKTDEVGDKAEEKAISLIRKYCPT